ncbi:Uncharacterised protein [Clostridium sporogenes]|uniref:Nucleoside 2-deoxyribosyltransferase n=1 Tax=Clostridium sporogenes TaxID=1509 RepID=A0A7U4LP30_CLOSG|nr:hypothetical protein [Clostridium sporogenes]AKC63725.1 hypothetical protein CLSPO_c30050 [Clostridium sporogenes]AKJ90876.1 hypothetical protein CLSPOx_15030 [Clostridium sporogenes]KCZ67423.1 hypothetical protein CSPO_9c04380 [Clostridium sporogenes]OOO66271.1 hypothetical protein BS099_11360 [Clostridium sporogenes]SQC03471.1 Uncharacterised protein [Clostridium sporogenes]
MSISVFLSYPQPYLQRQKDFIDEIRKYLEGRGFCTRTLGVTDYDIEAPLVAIRRLMLESNGLLTIAFRRAYIKEGTGKPNTNIVSMEEYNISDKWLTSPYCQIEPAMAFQIGLPILIFREKGVIDDGILERGVVGTYMPEFDLDKPADKYFRSDEWKQLIGKWEAFVRNVSDNKGLPPKLY